MQEDLPVDLRKTKNRPKVRYGKFHPNPLDLVQWDVLDSHFCD